MSRHAKPPRPERRRHGLVDGPTQRRVLACVGRGMGLHLGVFLGLFLLTAPAAAALYEDWLSSGRSPWASPGFVILSVAVPVLCTFLGAAGHLLQHASRVVGPCYRFTQVSKDLSRLRIPRGVRIRRGDHLTETAAALDAGMVAMHDAVLRLQRASAKLDEAFEQQASGDPREDSSRMREQWEEVRRSAMAFTPLTHAPECEVVPLSQEREDDGPEVQRPVPALETTECNS